MSNVFHRVKYQKHPGSVRVSQDYVRIIKTTDFRSKH